MVAVVTCKSACTYSDASSRLIRIIMTEELLFIVLVLDEFGVTVHCHNDKIQSVVWVPGGIKRRMQDQEHVSSAFFCSIA